MDKAGFVNDDDAIRPVQSEDSELPERRRVIRYIDDDAIDVETGPSTGFRGRSASRRRRGSASSSLSGRRGLTGRTVDPAILLPIEYRTVSFHLEDTRERKEREIKTKKPTQKGSSQATATDLADLTWHKLSVQDACQQLSTSTQTGLSEVDVREALGVHGRNVPSKPRSQLPKKIFWYFFGGFGSLLFVGAVLVFIAWRPLGDPNPAKANLALAIVLLAVWIIQAIFNGYQDFSTSRFMDSITGMLPEDCLVIRNDAQTTIGATDVVPGDIMLVKAGVKLSADVRFIGISANTRFDRSILTGESLPIAATLDSTDENYLETKCIGLQGTHCISGSCTALVVATGDRTVFGRIAALTNKPDTRRTSLQKEVLRFVTIIVSLAACFIILVIIIWASYLQQQHNGYLNVAALIVSCVSVGIAFVPEGLPIALTASMTIVANIMKRNSVLCKSLKTVETLGSVNVICSDKTGTLTRNNMTVTNACVARKTLDTAQAVNEIQDKDSTLAKPMSQMRTLAAICNAGEFDVTTIDWPLEERRIIGDATDQAVLRFAEALGPHQDERDAWIKKYDIPFNSKNKFMVRIFSAASQQLEKTQHEQPVVLEEADPNEGGRFLAIKGAPDILLPRCMSILDEQGLPQKLDSAASEDIRRIKDEWSAEGKRVILMARKDMPSNGSLAIQEEAVLEYATTGLTLVGLLAIVDPPRSEIPEVVGTLRTAGIRVFMVTGDFKLTALAIAKSCGIVTTKSTVDDASALSSFNTKHSLAISNDESESSSGSEIENEGSKKAIVMNGSELSTLNEQQWTQLCNYDEIVFARTTPEQKLRIVEEFQKHQNVVAMTGDGVNDAPSLKAADVGVAIQGGSDIAIEAADMVLLDSFSGIVQAVLYGRVIFDNLKKTIIYLLPAGSFSEFWPVFTNVIFGLPQILSSFLMIMICCLTDCAAAMTLALEKPEADVLLRKPRDPRKDRLVDWKLLLHAYGFVGIIECTTSFAMAYWNAQRRGVPFSALWFTYGNYGDLDKDYVLSVLNECSSVYFVNLVVMQWFNLLAVRTRRLSILQHPPIFRKATRNLPIFPAIVFALAMIFIFCYIPGLQTAIGSTQVPVEYFFLPIGFGFALLLLDEARKAAVRKWPEGLLAKIAW